MKTNSALDIEKYREEQEILHATYATFGDIPVDEKYLPVMRAFLRVYAAQYADKVLMNLMSEPTAAAIEAINKNRTEWVGAMKEFDKLRKDG